MPEEMPVVLVIICPEETIISVRAAETTIMAITVIMQEADRLEEPTRLIPAGEAEKHHDRIERNIKNIPDR